MNAPSSPARTARVERRTRETRIAVELDLDGSGRADLASGIPFLDHMLDQVARHGMVDLTVRAEGDLEIDAHHTVEDIGIVLGQALAKAAGDKAGIARYGFACVPMDETLVRCALDLSGRPYFVPNLGELRREVVGGLPTEMVEHFFRSFSTHFPMNLHLDVIRGHDTHHIIEGVFKSVTRALRAALTVDPRQQGVPSTKGVL